MGDSRSFSYGDVNNLKPGLDWVYFCEHSGGFEFNFEYILLPLECSIEEEKKPQ